jgi:putative FmdB family regulatory protein
MPIYDYVCHHCGHRFEVIHGVHAAGPVTCPSCGGGPVRKAFAPPTIHFKGTGWAKKDRGATARRAARDDESKSAPAAANATDASGSDAKGSTSNSSGDSGTGGGGGSTKNPPTSSTPTSAAD